MNSDNTKPFDNYLQENECKKPVAETDTELLDVDNGFKENKCRKMMAKTTQKACQIVLKFHRCKLRFP